MRVATSGLAVVMFAAALAGCGMEPGAPLVSLRERPATILPSEVPAVDPTDGFPVILADPVTVAGLPRPAAEVAAETAELERRRVAQQARAARLAASGGSAAELATLGRTHVEDTRRAIEASGQARTGAVPREIPAAQAQPTRFRPSRARPAAARPNSTSLQAAANASEAAAAAPLDPSAPPPRAIGGAPPFVPAHPPD